MSDTSSPSELPNDDAAGANTRQRNQVIWTIWLTYGAFYFCRSNIAVAVAAGMGDRIEEGGLGLTGDQIGTILAALKLAYGFGQLINGQLSERVSPRILLAFGMFGSAALNVLFGFSTGFYFLLFVWACNGYCQSLGWTPCVRVVGNWIPVLLRGKAIGIIGTGYQLTAGLTFFVSGMAAEHYGWRGAMIIPAAILVTVGLFTLLTLKSSPDHKNTKVSQGDIKSIPPRIEKQSLSENLWLTISNPALWLMGIALGLLNACRYGFLDWGILHLIEVQKTGVGKASLKYVVLAFGGIAGSYLAGWATDRFFGGRRAPAVVILLIALGILTLVYESVVSTSSPIVVFILLATIGFCIFGPQVLLVGTAPTDLARRGTAAAAAGFVNFLGYMGAAAGDKVTGYYKMEEHGGWHVAIYIWAGWAFAAALFAALLWNATARQESQSSTKE